MIILNSKELRCKGMFKCPRCGGILNQRIIYICGNPINISTCDRCGYRSNEVSIHMTDHTEFNPVYCKTSNTSTSL